MLYHCTRTGGSSLWLSPPGRAALSARCFPQVRYCHSVLTVTCLCPVGNSTKTLLTPVGAEGLFSSGSIKFRGRAARGERWAVFGRTGGNSHLSRVSGVRKAVSGSVRVNSALSDRSTEIGTELLLCGISRSGAPSFLMQGWLIFHFSEMKGGGGS